MTAYAVNLGNNDGFVLVVGNDQSHDILGYCDHGTFNEQQMPPNMRSWLESYMASAAAVKDVNTARSLRSAPGVPTKTPIAPLLKCQWNQDAPYNDQCPVIDGQHCATGCTNTAMAQVMFYHKWPAGTTATIPSYIPDNSGGTHYPTLPALEPTTFDWSKIYPTYLKGEDGTEVARLFKYLGTVSLTNYGKESGATGYNAMLGIIKYFDYDASASTVWCRQRNYNEWIDMLYAELQAKRPVMFSGTTPDGAHSFVVDGYMEEDYFHVNWGWGGYSDGYYRVVLMDPNEQGIGGSPITGDNIVKNKQAQSIKLSDEHPFFTPFMINAQHISYTRTPERYFDIRNDKGWTTLILSFAATSCQATINGVDTPLRWYTDNTDGELMVVTFKYENGSELFFGFPETTLNAFYPYLLGVPSTLNENTSLMNVPITFSADNVEVAIDYSSVTGRDYKMRGTMSPMKDEKEIYVLNTDGSAFVYGTHSVNPFHAYCVPIGSQNPADQLTIKLTFNTPTGISEIIDNETNDLQGPYYNINGQRVSRPGKGIYIVNGKKILFK
ncbi:MAG: C10 family peptidase [Muribaculaceae bacterium]|nr:C10 family peptidase [Muribaculaceae bacterium]